MAGKPLLEVTGAELLLNLIQKLLCWVSVVLGVGYGINSEALGVTSLCTMSYQITEDSASSDGKQPFSIQQPAIRYKEGTYCRISTGEIGRAHV